MAKLKTPVLILLAIVCPLPASAADPPGADSTVSDPRLLTKITLASHAARLPDTMKELTDASKIAFTVYPSRESWWVGELSVMIAAKDLPVGRVKDALCELLNLRWARYGKEGQWSYALWQDRRTRDRDDAELAAENERALEPVREGVRSIAQLARRTAAMSATERDRASANDPVTRFLLNDPFGKSYAGLMSALEPAIQSAQSSPLSARLVEVPLASLSAPQRSAVREFVRQGALVEARVGDRQSGDKQIDWDRVVVRIARGPESGGPPPGAMFGELDLQGVSSMHGFPLMGSDSPLLKVFATYIPRLNAGEDPKALEREVEQAFGKELELLEKPGPKLPEPWMAVPELQKKIRLTMKSDQTGPELLMAIAGLSQIPAYAETWEVGPLGLEGEEERTVAEALKLVLERWHMLCDYRRGAILVTAPDRLMRRAAMVPKADVDALAERSRKQFGLNAADLAGIVSAYRPEQIVTLMKEPALHESLLLLGKTETRAALQFYGALSSQERAAAISSAGLLASTLADANWELLNAVLQSSAVPRDWSRDPNLRIAYMNCAPDAADVSPDLGPGEWLAFSIAGGERRTTQIAPPPSRPPKPKKPAP